MDALLFMMIETMLFSRAYPGEDGHSQRLWGSSHAASPARRSVVAGAGPRGFVLKDSLDDMRRATTIRRTTNVRRTADMLMVHSVGRGTKAALRLFADDMAYTSMIICPA
jgi:hypothetical protein